MSFEGEWLSELKRAAFYARVLKLCRTPPILIFARCRAADRGLLRAISNVSNVPFSARTFSLPAFGRAGSLLRMCKALPKTGTLKFWLDTVVVANLTVSILGAPSDSLDLSLASRSFSEHKSFFICRQQDGGTSNNA